MSRFQRALTRSTPSEACPGVNRHEQITTKPDAAAVYYALIIDVIKIYNIASLFSVSAVIMSCFCLCETFVVTLLHIFDFCDSSVASILSKYLQCEERQNDVVPAASSTWCYIICQQNCNQANLLPFFCCWIVILRARATHSTVCCACLPAGDQPGRALTSLTIAPCFVAVCHLDCEISFGLVSVHPWLKNCNFIILCVISDIGR